MKVNIGTILKAPLIILVFISFGASIYAYTQDLIKFPTVIILGLIVVSYLIGMFLSRKKKEISKDSEVKV